MAVSCDSCAGGGLAYSTLGSTHIAVEDVGLMRSVPNLTILAPGDADEVEFYLEQALAMDGPGYIRMPRQARDAPVEDRRTVELGKAEVLGRGADAVLYTYGPSAEEAMRACRILKEQGISVSVLNFTTIKPLDTEAVLAHAKGKKVAVLTANKHHLREEYLLRAKIVDRDHLVILSLHDQPEWGRIYTHPNEEFNLEAVAGEVVGVVRKGLEENPDIGAVVLECTDLPPYSVRIRDELDIPVFDVNIMISYVALSLNEYKMF